MATRVGSPVDPVERLRQLNLAATAAQLAENEEGVFSAIGAAVLAAGLSSHIATFDERGTRLVIRHVAPAGGWLARAERLLERSILGLSMPVEAVPAFRAAREGRTTSVTNCVEQFQAALPWLPAPAARAIVSLIRVQEAVTAPVADGRTVFGVLSVWGAGVGELELRSIELLGRQAGAALASQRLRAAVAEQARLDGAIKTARAVVHELANKLGILSGYGSLIPTLSAEQLAEVAADMAEAAAEANTTLRQLQRIVRFEETDIGGGPMLNLDRASEH